jgi:hypothetical protein
VKESDIQIEVVDWFKSKQSEYRFRIFSVPNEGQRKVWYLNKLVRMGLKSGVPDLILEFPEGRMVYLEIKAEKGKLSETQQNWLKVSKVFQTPTLRPKRLCRRKFEPFRGCSGFVPRCQDQI